MSANDFQTKYSSVMESMLKGAVAETTKLFETMVDELKAEISRIKKENEDLKTKCSQFEKATSYAPVYNRGSEPRAGPRDRRDRAVQCDLVPYRTVLVEQCQPLRRSSLQNQEQQRSNEDSLRTEYSLQDHNYGGGPTQMAFLLLDSYNDSSTQSALKREEVEPTVVCELVLSDKAGSTQASLCGTENEGTLNQECSTGETRLPGKETSSGLQGAQNQLSESEHPLVISLAPLTDNMEEESEVNQKISATQEEVLKSDRHPFVVARRPSEVESPKKEQPLVAPRYEQADVTLQQNAHVQSAEEPLAHPTPLNKGDACKESNSGVAEGEAISQPESPVRRKRGRPPKKWKRVNDPVKDTASPAVTVTSLSRSCSSEKEKPSGSQKLSVEMKEGASQTPSKEVSCGTKTLSTPTDRPRERCSSVTLQDALLLVEAMNQSTVQNTVPSPQKIAAPPHTVQIGDKVTTEPQTPLSPVETHKATGSLPVTETSRTTQLSAVPATADAALANKGQAYSVTAKQQHTVPSTSAAAPVIPSTAAVQTSMQPPQLLPLVTSVAPSKPGEATSHKINVMPQKILQKITPLSPTQLPTVVSKVVAAQKNSALSGSTAAGLPFGAPSHSSVPYKTIYVAPRKSYPIVTSQSTATSTEPQSVTLTQPKITILIPRQMSVVASKKYQSQTVSLTGKQDSAKSPAPVTEPVSQQSISSSQELSVSVDTPIASDEMATTSSQKGAVNTSDDLKPPKQTPPVSETPTEGCSSPDMSDGRMSPPTLEQNLSAVVRLTRLPFPVSATEAVVVSELSSDVSQAIWKEDSTREKPLSVVISKVTSLAVNTSQVYEPNDIQEQASLSPKNSLFLEESSDSTPSTPPAFETSALPVNMTRPSAVSGTAAEPDLNEETISAAVQDCALPKDPPVHLTAVTNNDASDPHLRMTKAQFLAQLAVTPVTQDPEKASPDDSVDATASCAETCSTSKKRLQKNTPLSEPQSHLKTNLQPTTETNPEQHTETHTVNPKKPRLECNSANDENTTREPIPISPKTPGVDEDVTSPKKATNDLIPIRRRRSALFKKCVRPKRAVSEPTYVSSRRGSLGKDKKSTSVSPRRFSSKKESVSSKTKKSSSVSPRRSSSVKEIVSSKTKNSTSVSPKRSGLTKESASSKTRKGTSVSPRRAASAIESATPKKTKNISVHPRRLSSTRDGASPQNGVKSIRTTSVSPKRTSLSRDGDSQKKTKSSSIGPRKSGVGRNCPSPKVLTPESTFCRRRCTLPKDGSIGKHIKWESSASGPMYDITSHGANAKNTMGETSSQSGRRPRLAKDGDSPRKTGESTPAKKPRLIQDDAGPKRVVNSKSVAKASKCKIVAKMNNSSQLKLQSGAKTSPISENRGSCEVVRKCTAKGIWTPPTMLASEIPPAVGKKSPATKEAEGHSVVYPPSVSLFPIPVKAPPVVSPLQPLSVIGRRLLKNQCGECGRVLSSIAALESHVSLHRGRRPFSCTLCGKSFPDSKGLKRHGRVHRNGRIHICQHCGKGFVYSFGLTKHLQMVHSRIKPFICQICSKGFFTRRDVEAHIRIHTGEKPFHCNLCEKKFARRVELNVHLRWHNGEKRHWCPFCGKGFLDFNNLKRHKYIHTGEKPHSCPHCPKHFTQSGHLKKHVKNVHKIE